MIACFSKEQWLLSVNISTEEKTYIAEMSLLDIKSGNVIPLINCLKAGRNAGVIYVCGHACVNVCARVTDILCVT